MVATALPSATLMILREGPDGLQVLLGRRRQGRAFGELHVFPGGVIDAADERTAGRAHGLSESQARQRLGIAGGALRYWIAAVREAFEETSLLFLRGEGPGVPQLRRLRRRLVTGGASFEQLCSEHDYELDLTGIYYVAHWITPEVRPVRFDTRFFLAALPAGQEAAHDGVELTESVWLTPGAALDRLAAGEIKLATPTRAELNRLAQFHDVAAALAWAAECWQPGVPSILPVVETEGGRERVLLPPAVAGWAPRGHGDDG